MITETNHGTGAIIDIPDERDYHFGEHIAGAGIPFDWEKGYDCEEELRIALNDPTFTLPVNDQDGSFSCGGQAQSKKGEVISALHNKKFTRKSAKFPYAQVFVGTGGSAGRDLCKIASTQGFGNEADVSSYDAGNPPAEPFMERKSDITDQSKQNAGSDKAMLYADVQPNIDIVAEAMRDTHGVILGIYGQNNGTWRTAFPLPPDPVTNPASFWAHWVFLGKAKLINGKKYVGFINSWGESTGDKGWQWIGEDYFNAKWGIFNIWTMLYSSPQPTPLFGRTLVIGMKGDDVKQLQTLLKINADGIYGMNTLAHVKLFQTLHGLKPDGVVGNLTAQKLLNLTQ